MAREYARIRISLADDEEFEQLIPEAQWLYLRVLLPEPSLNYAGVCDWRPNRLVGKARGIDVAYILRGAADLEENRYALFDTATEEALVRTLIRSDELLRNPKMAPAVVKGYQTTASKVLRAAIVTEVRKAKDEHPEYNSWNHKDTKEDLDRLLTRSSLDSVEYTNQIVVPITNRIGNPDPVPITNTDQGVDSQPDSVPIPSHLAPNTPHLSPDTQQPGAPSGATRGTRLPEGWRPTDETIAEMRSRFPALNLKVEHEKFTNHWNDKTGKDATKRSWEGTWRNWMIRAAEQQTPQRNGQAPAARKVGVGLELANRLGNTTPELTA